MDINDISGTIVNAAFEIHTNLGPGLPEEVFRQCLKHELLLRKLKVVSELDLPVAYKGVKINLSDWIDLLVEDSVVVEIKAVHQLSPVHRAQLLTYTKLSDKSLSLFLNFGSRLIKDGIIRVINSSSAPLRLCDQISSRQFCIR